MSLGRLVKLLGVAMVLLAVGGGSFLGARALKGDSGAEAEKPDAKYPSPEVFAAEQQQPRFVGEVLGIFIGPKEVPVPDKFLTYEELCGPDALTARVPDERAEQLDLKVQLPPEYVFQPGSMNTGVIACAPRDEMEILGEESLRLKDPNAGVVYAARWEYTITPYTKYPASIIVGRSRFTHETFSAAESRVKTIIIGGRQAVLIEPVTPNGMGSSGAVLFPEQFGVTFIYAGGLPLADLLAVAEIVAGATQAQQTP